MTRLTKNDMVKGYSNRVPAHTMGVNFGTVLKSEASDGDSQHAIILWETGQTILHEAWELKRI